MGFGVGVSVLAWMYVGVMHPIFTQVAVSGLVPDILAGLLGGAVAGAVAPRHKIVFAVGVGVVLAALLLSFMLRHGFSHGPYRPVLLWYWPMYLPALYAIGAFLTRKVWRAV